MYEVETREIPSRSLLWFALVPVEAPDLGEWCYVK
jgi:hypothetical protein